MDYDLIIQGGHVVDPALGTDGVTSVAVKDGVIAEVGDAIDATKAAKVVDASGKYVSPGWMDMHVHSYSTLSFSDPDTIGVLHGADGRGRRRRWCLDLRRLPPLLGGALQDRYVCLCPPHSSGHLHRGQGLAGYRDGEPD